MTISKREIQIILAQVEPTIPPESAYPACSVCGASRVELSFTEQGTGVCMLCEIAQGPVPKTEGCPQPVVLRHAALARLGVAG